MVSPAAESHAVVKNDEHLPVVMQGDVQHIWLSWGEHPKVQNSINNSLFCVCRKGAMVHVHT